MVLIQVGNSSHSYNTLFLRAFLIHRFSKIFCGSFGRIFQTQEAIENSPMTEPLEKDSPIRIVSESPSCKSCSERDETSASEKDQELKPSQPRNPPGSYYSESIAKQFSANFEGRNPAEVERVKMDFLDQCRSKYAAPQTHDEVSAFNSTLKSIHLTHLMMPISRCSRTREIVKCWNSRPNIWTSSRSTPQILVHWPSRRDQKSVPFLLPGSVRHV